MAVCDSGLTFAFKRNLCRYTSEVRGHGVVGRQPVLEQGSEFSYTGEVGLYKFNPLYP